MAPRGNLRPADGNDSTETVPPVEIAQGTNVTPGDVASAGSRLRQMKVDGMQRISASQATSSKPTIPPTLPTLLKVFGPALLDIFPDEFRQAIDDAYKFWQENPDSYLTMDADDIAQREEILVCMRAYAEIAPDGPYTIRTVSHANPLLIVWRAQNKRGTSGTDSSEGS